MAWSSLCRDIPGFYPSVARDQNLLVALPYSWLFVHRLHYVLSGYSIHLSCTYRTTDFITMKYVFIDDMSKVSAEIIAGISARMDNVDPASCLITGADTAWTGGIDSEACG